MECNGNLADEAVSGSAEDLSDYTDADESISAPTEILAEFLSAVMLKDYDAALKHCKMILQYEPNHATAKEFYPLIMERLVQASSENKDTGSSADESSDSSSDESSDSSSDESSESESVEDEEEADEEEDEKKTTDSDATTASYSSLEDEEADNVAASLNSPVDNNAFVSPASSHNNNNSDSESPTEPVSQAQLTARLRAQILPLP